MGLPQSKKLIGFSDDGKFGFVEGGNGTGLHVSEIIPADSPDNLSGQVSLRMMVRMPDLGKNAQGVKMRQDVFSLVEGEAVIHWPTPLSPDSIADLEQWLELVKRKIKRSVAEPSEKLAE